MRNYPKALKRKLLDTICQMREDLSAYATDPNGILHAAVNFPLKRCAGRSFP